MAPSGAKQENLRGVSWQICDTKRKGHYLRRPIPFFTGSAEVTWLERKEDCARMVFWIVTVGLAAFVAATLALAFLRTRPDARPPAAYDLDVYRDQLREVERDVARNVLSEADAERVRAEEESAILKVCQDCRYVFVMDERGKELSSAEFAKDLRTVMDTGHSQVAFVIGGAYGVSEAVRQRADRVMALSRMTFPHQFVRAVLYEQIYRAFTIIRGEPYHK